MTSRERRCGTCRRIVFARPIVADGTVAAWVCRACDPRRNPPPSPATPADTGLEHGVARRLGITPVELRRLALELYGRPLRAERDRRGPGLRPAMVGYITRELTAELRRHLDTTAQARP